MLLSTQPLLLLPLLLPPMPPTLPLLPPRHRRVLTSVGKSPAGRSHARRSSQLAAAGGRVQGVVLASCARTADVPRSGAGGLRHHSSPAASRGSARRAARQLTRRALGCIKDGPRRVAARQEGVRVAAQDDVEIWDRLGRFKIRAVACGARKGARAAAEGLSTRAQPGRAHAGGGGMRTAWRHTQRHQVSRRERRAPAPVCDMPMM